MMSAAETNNVTNGHVSIPVFVIVLLIGGVIYVFGYLRAVMHRANKDYKATKAAVKPLRKAFWAALWSVFKVGVAVVLAGIVMIAWVVRDVRSDKPVPAAVTPCPSAAARHSPPTTCTRPR